MWGQFSGESEKGGAEFGEPKRVKLGGKDRSYLLLYGKFFLHIYNVYIGGFRLRVL